MDIPYLAAVSIALDSALSTSMTQSRYCPEGTLLSFLGHVVGCGNLEGTPLNPSDKDSGVWKQ